MIDRHLTRLFGAAVATTSGLLATVLPTAAVPSASAQGCPDTEVVFARGTGEDPGVGPTGQAFVDSLRGRLGGKSMDVYPVNYPASDQWSTGIDGIRDAGTHVVSERQPARTPRWCSAVTPRRGRDGLRHFTGRPGR